MLATLMLFLFGMMVLSRMANYLGDYFEHRIDGWTLAFATWWYGLIFSGIIWALVTQLGEHNAAYA